MPIPALAVMLFAAILSAILCSSQAAIEREEESYQEVRRNVPVALHVSDLTGSTTENLAAPGWVADAMRIFLDNYVKDFEAKLNIIPSQLSVNGAPEYVIELTGITSFAMAPELGQGSDGLVTWLEGFDESILRTEELVCLIPESMAPEKTQLSISVDICFESFYGNEQFVANRSFAVVGVHKNSTGIYCPAAVVEDILRHLQRSVIYDRVGGVLIDNEKLEEFRSASTRWFATPNPKGELTPWEYTAYDYYPYALIIDDSQLVAAKEALESSIMMNKICALLVFILSAVAGFFLGFLIVRRRNKEIVLMRTMGTSNRSIYCSFTLEQMLCVILGIVLGGSYNGWHPADRLGILAAIYFVGLTVALQIFLHKNLLTTIKEDE